MKFGTSLYCQNYPDWDRFNAGQFGPGPAIPDHVKVLEDVKVGELADDLGFDRIWSIEHHFTPYTMVPSVTQFLAYFAGKVKNAGVGTMVIVLPWHEPLRVAEQIALLDILLQGRSFAIGFGRGAARREFEGLRIPMSESRDRFVESAKIVKMALTQERFSYDGEFYKIPEISIRPQPMNKNLTDNMYCAAQSRQSVNMAADADLRLIVVPQKDWDEYSDDIRVYNIRRREQGMEARRPIVGCNVYCTNDLDDAQETFWDAVHDHAMSAIHHYELDEPEHFKEVGGYDHYAEAAYRIRDGGAGSRHTHSHTQIWGTPEMCLEAIREIQGKTHPEEMYGVFKFGAMPLEKSIESMKLFAKEVLPEIHKDQLMDPL
jgi:alkanesulfonate monooxygenase SsuD/methylene tetrahydromethanopterin reductase-like flavin-dependent oxidoreductase (luciferase family)